MKVEIIKKNEAGVDTKNTKTNQKLRVCAYARVSTDMEEQQTSFISQQKYYFDKINNNPEWTFIEVYADEGISGTQAFKRENFMRMIKDAQEGKIDLILTKSISRFARNTVDTLNYVRLLRSRNVGILFEEEGINTLDMAGELLLTILSSVAQQESETISSHVKLGFKMKKERGEIVGQGSCYGYHYDFKKKEMTIIEHEASIVRLIFQKYNEGFGCKTIARMLTDMKEPSPRGKPKWGESSVSEILKNEKYYGDVVQGKSYVVNPITHQKRRNRGEEDFYIIKDHHEPIISKEIFDKAKLMRDSKNHSRFTGRRMGKKYTFSGRLRCAYCGGTYIKKSLYRKRAAWDCLAVAKKGREFCPDSKIVYEDVIQTAFTQAFLLLTKDNSLVLEQFLAKVKQTMKGDDSNKTKLRLESEIREMESKRGKLVDLYVNGQVDHEVFNQRNNTMQDKIDKLKNKLEQAEQIAADDAKIDLGLNKIRDSLNSFLSSNNTSRFDEALFEALVDYVIVGGYEKNGEKNNYIIRFIIKNGFELRSRGDITDEKIVENNRLEMEHSIFTPIIDFVSNQNIIVFNKVGSRLQKDLVTRVRVTVEVEN